jgi:hypothetical protein
VPLEEVTDVGILSALAGLPLAPVKGMVTLAKQIAQRADQEREAELAELQAELLEFQLMHDLDPAASEELSRKEDELLERVGALVGAGAAEGRE